MHHMLLLAIEVRATTKFTAVLKCLAK